MSDTEPQDTDQEASDSEDINKSNPNVTTTDRDDGLSDEDREQLEKEREERLDPDNRPVNAVVDNTGREFDNETEDFKYAAGEEPGAKEETTAVIGADRPDRPDGVESDVDED